MMTGTNGHTFLVEDRRDIVWVDIRKIRNNQPGTARQWTVDGYTALREYFQSIRRRASPCAFMASMPMLSDNLRRRLVR